MAKIGISMDDWVVRDAGLGDAKNKSARVQELVIKGMMYETQQTMQVETLKEERSPLWQTRTSVLRQLTITDLIHEPPLEATFRA